MAQIKRIGYKPYQSLAPTAGKPINYGIKDSSPIVSTIAQYRDPLAGGFNGSMGGALPGAAAPPASPPRNSTAAGSQQTPPVQQQQQDPSRQAQDLAGQPFQLDYTSDPMLQKVRALAATSVADARARAAARRKQLAVDFGDEAFAREITGDESYAQAAKDNPFSVVAQLMKQREERTREFDDATNKANLWYSGFRGQGLSDLERNFLQAQSEAQGRVRGELSEIEAALLEAEREWQQRQLDSEGDAYDRARANAGSGGGGGGAGAADPVGGEPREPGDPWQSGFVDQRLDPLPWWARRRPY